MELAGALPRLAGEDFQSHPHAFVARAAWLVRLRWLALAGVLGAALLAPAVGLRSLHLPVLLGAVAAGVLYNSIFTLLLERSPERLGNPLLHALPDFGALTVVLWASGGVANPFVSLYFVHVLLASVLSGARATITACAAALVGTAFLVSAESWEPLRIASFTPDARFAPVLEGVAYVITLLACAYVASRAARELSARNHEIAAAKRARRRDEEILHSALDRLEVGLEILEPDGTPRFRNRHLLQTPVQRDPCPHRSGCEAARDRCPVDEAREGRSGSCRYSRRDPGGRERVIELLSFPLGEALPAPVLRLHLDRTENVLAERKLLFAERLASLGRTVQAVAHELNTPLATIQTLAADMHAALSAQTTGSDALGRDLDESALLILDEMRRCRAITQGLLAGREALHEAPGDPCSPLGPSLTRAAALVFGTGVARSRLRLDEGLDELRLAIGPDAVVQIFVNLLQNAADAIEGDSAARIFVRRAKTSAPGRITLHIDDEGPGLPPGARDRVFEAFFTTKPPGKGTGLGLYTTLSLLREAGGSLALAESPSGGVRATLELPAGASA